MFHQTLRRAGSHARVLAAAIAVTTSALSAAAAATVSVTAVNGIWTAAAPGNAPNLNGIGTSTINWGTGSQSGGFRQSSYTFSGPSGLPVALTSGQSFVLGQFTHSNWPIVALPAPSSITGATLQITFDLLVGGTAQTISQIYDFAHWETANAAAPCADGGTVGSGVDINGCADRVQATLNPAVSDTFTIGGVDYQINISAFQGFAPDANGVPTFWTVESSQNTADLIATFDAVDVPPAPVPLPATGLLLLAALGTAGAIRRRA